MLTTPDLITFLQLREGFRKDAYDDKHPNKVLTADTPIEGTLTIGYGTTSYPDGSPVKWNHTVTKSEAVDYLTHFVRDTVEPALANLIHVPLTGEQYNALGSNIYQFGEPEVAGWKLIQRINSCEPWENIAREWVNGTVAWGDNPNAFWSRRVSEVFAFCGLDWRAGEYVSTDMDIIEAVQQMGFDGNLPRPVIEGSADEDLFQELEIPARTPVIDAIEDPTPDTPLTTQDLNQMERERLSNPVPITPISKRVPVEAINYLEPKDKVPGNITVKPVRDSDRGKGDIKIAVGEKSFIAGAGGSAAVAIGAAEPIIKMVDTYPKTAIATGFGLLLAVGIVSIYYGKYQRRRGEDNAEDLLG